MEWVRTGLVVKGRTVMSTVKLICESTQGELPEAEDKSLGSWEAEKVLLNLQLQPLISVYLQ